MPAIKRARDAAKIAICASNERQLAMAMVAYGSENEGNLPPGSFTHGGQAPNRFVQDKGDAVDVLYPEYVAPPESYYCPDGPFQPDSPMPSDYTGTVWAFYEPAGGWAPGHRMFYLSYCLYPNAKIIPGVYEDIPETLEDPGNWVLVSDYTIWIISGQAWTVGNHPASGWAGPIETPYGANTAQLDGSATWHPEREFELRYPQWDYGNDYRSMW